MAGKITFHEMGFYGEEITPEQWTEAQAIVLDEVSKYDDPNERVLAAKAALLAAGYFVIDGDGTIFAATLGLLSF